MFWNTFHHILMHFVHQFQCFEVFLKCVFVIFKTVFFLKNFVSICLFWLIQSVFRSIEIVLKLFKVASAYFDWSKLILDQSKLFWNFFKFLKKPLSVSINQNWFSINRNSWIRFFKNQIWLVQSTFQKGFTNFFSLSETHLKSTQLQVKCVLSKN